MESPVEPIDVSVAELEALLEQARPSLSPEGYEKLRAAIRTLGYVTELLAKQGTTLAALRELLCPASTEKTAKVLQQAGIQKDTKPKPESSSPPPKSTTTDTDATARPLIEELRKSPFYMAL